MAQRCAKREVTTERKKKLWKEKLLPADWNNKTLSVDSLWLFFLISGTEMEFIECKVYTYQMNFTQCAAFCV